MYDLVFDPPDDDRASTLDRDQTASAILPRLRRLLTTRIPPRFHQRGPADLDCLCDGCVSDGADDEPDRDHGIPTLRQFMRRAP